jgi:RluA family pseudouridine synthase
MDKLKPEILLETEAVVGINKPAGLLSIPDGYNRELPHVAGLLAADFGKLWIVHRLDRDTSGVMILAKSPSAHRLINLQFEKREIRKIYHAIVVGEPAWEHLLVDQPLRVGGDRRHRTTIAPKTGKPAATEFKILQRYPKYTLVEACPHTGYTHQIRAHLLFAGYPIVADPLYFLTRPENNATESPAAIMSRLALHASELRFVDPISATLITLQAPYPEDFSTALLTIR